MFFSLDGLYENKQLFIVVDSSNNGGRDSSKLESVDMPRYTCTRVCVPMKCWINPGVLAVKKHCVCFSFSVKLTYQLFEDSPLDTDPSVGVVCEDSDEEEFGISVASSDPSPFSRRNEKVLFSSDKVTVPS